MLKVKESLWLLSNAARSADLLRVSLVLRHHSQAANVFESLVVGALVSIHACLRNWTNAAYDRLRESDPTPDLFATDLYRCMPALEKAPANDRKGGLTGPWLENVDRLLSAHTGHSKTRLMTSSISAFHGNCRPVGRSNKVFAMGATENGCAVTGHSQQDSARMSVKS